MPARCLGVLAIFGREAHQYQRDSMGRGRPLIGMHDRASAVAPIIQIYARCALCGHALVDVQADPRVLPDLLVTHGGAIDVVEAGLSGLAQGDPSAGGHCRAMAGLADPEPWQPGDSVMANLAGNHFAVARY